MQTQSAQLGLGHSLPGACHRVQLVCKACKLSRPIQVAALSTAQQALQDQIRKAQVASDVIQLVADKQPLIDSVLASTAVQKLAYLSQPEYETARLRSTVAELAGVVSCNLTELSSPIDVLAGLAELQFKSPATDQLLEVFVFQYDLSQQPSSGKDTAPKQWDTVSWGWADNSNEACKDLVTIIWAFGRLLQKFSPHLLKFVDDIAAELSKKLHNNLLKEAFTPDDLADVVDAVANVREVCVDCGSHTRPR